MNPKSAAQGRSTWGFLPRPAAAVFRFGAVLLGVVLVGGAAAGCGPAPELGPEAARTLQAQVLAVTEAAAANDPAGSLRLLDDLGAKLDQAAASGDVSSKRHQDIRSAIDAVRSDLVALQAAAAAEQAAAAEAARAAAEQAAATAPPPAVVAPAPAPAPAPADKGDDKGSDKGSDQGKGKGKD